MFIMYLAFPDTKTACTNYCRLLTVPPLPPLSVLDTIPFGLGLLR